jgi:hypothetical protein
MGFAQVVTDRGDADGHPDVLHGLLEPVLSINPLVIVLAMCLACRYDLDGDDVQRRFYRRALSAN